MTQNDRTLCVICISYLTTEYDLSYHLLRVLKGALQMAVYFDFDVF